MNNEIEKATDAAYSAGYYGALRDMVSVLPAWKLKELTPPLIEKRIAEHRHRLAKLVNK